MTLAGNSGPPKKEGRMTLKKSWEAIYAHTEIASNIARQLGFAGLAIIWIFKTDSGGIYSVPEQLISPGFFIVLALALDFMQYVTSSLIWALVTLKQERKGLNEDDEFYAAQILNAPGWVLFILKIIVTAIAYWLLLQYFYASVPT